MPIPPVPEPRSSHIWFDGDLIRWEDARIHVLSHVLHYGSSVFEGIRCYKTPDGPAVFRLREHIERLVYSARVARINLAYTVDELERACLDTIAANGLGECYIRPLVFRGAGAMGLLPRDCPTHVMIAVWEWGSYLGKEGMESGIDVAVSSWTKLRPNTLPALAKIGGAYVLATMAKMEAVQNGYAEAVLLDSEGRVAEGSGENIFAVIEGELITPPLFSSILGGITRKSVLQLARDHNMRVSEQCISRAGLYMAEELFFTGTAAEVTPIRSVDRIPVAGHGKVGPVTKAMQKEFFAIVHGEVPDRHRWLTRVAPAGVPR